MVVFHGNARRDSSFNHRKIVDGSSVVLRQVFRKLGGAKLHLGDTGMRGYDLPVVVDFWRFMVLFPPLSAWNSGIGHENVWIPSERIQFPSVPLLRHNCGRENERQKWQKSDEDLEVFRKTRAVLHLEAQEGKILTGADATQNSYQGKWCHPCRLVQGGGLRNA
jgi:hypothetical protein